MDHVHISPFRNHPWLRCNTAYLRRNGFSERLSKGINTCDATPHGPKKSAAYRYNDPINCTHTAKPPDLKQPFKQRVSTITGPVVAHARTPQEKAESHLRRPTCSCIHIQLRYLNPNDCRCIKPLPDPQPQSCSYNLHLRLHPPDNHSMATSRSDWGTGWV